jgi:hypothetical protein
LPQVCPREAPSDRCAPTGDTVKRPGPLLSLTRTFAF